MLTVLLLTFIACTCGFVRHYKREVFKLKSSETDDEIRERLRTKMRKNLYNDKGVAFAPWVVNQIDEEVILQLLRGMISLI